MKIPEYFGSMVFDDKVMRANLSDDIYHSLKRTINQNATLNIDVANAVADAMKKWAVEHGATHFTHWFQPLTGITAEKHDSFITRAPDGRVIMEFSGKELIQGEPDASSFPNGGLRATFEARGYTAWDPTSYAFIKDNTLCIPTAFCSYGGEALDKKTPLLRSMEALNKQALRILRLFGHTDVKCVQPCVGPEQEYFLIARELYEQRMDLRFSGRTLFGAKAPKGQDMTGHYAGTIKPRVAAYMAELDEELWKLGIFAKTEHNETAPSQHELAPIYTTCNIAADHNQLTMEIMQKVAERHNLVCLLHEKPFAGVNGGGKHNNWSMQTDSGVNLLSPGRTPYENAQFLLFLCAVIKAVDDYQELLRISVATASNDLRLGGSEAPPAIISIFLGDELSAILDAIESDKPYRGGGETLLKLGAHVLPRIPKDTTDRNRTSPFAFTGNKFEFRMLGSSNSITCANIMLNTAVAESLRIYADRLEGAADFETALHDMIKKTIHDHKRIVFNGNGYDDAWIKEATEKRGLANLPTTPDAFAHLMDAKNVKLLSSHRVFSEAELRSRYEINLKQYCGVLSIEAQTMVSMARREILPAIEAYMTELSTAAAARRAILPELKCSYETDTAARLTVLADGIYSCVNALDSALDACPNGGDALDAANYMRDSLLPKMGKLRALADEAETLTAEKYWPFPTYGKLLFSL